jgi:hypothetical protein
MAKYLVISCPKCSQKLRIPNINKRLKITCKVCGNRFEYFPVEKNKKSIFKTFKDNFNSFLNDISPNIIPFFKNLNYKVKNFFSNFKFYLTNFIQNLKYLFFKIKTDPYFLKNILRSESFPLVLVIILFIINFILNLLIKK